MRIGAYFCAQKPHMARPRKESPWKRFGFQIEIRQFELAMKFKTENGIKTNNELMKMALDKLLGMPMTKETEKKPMRIRVSKKKIEKLKLYLAKVNGVK